LHIEVSKRKYEASKSIRTRIMSAILVDNLKLSDGRLYSGECRDGMPHGVGEATYPSGNGYKGTWKQGREWGVGKVKENGMSYEGDMSGGSAVLSSTIVDDMETVYVGATFNFAPHGEGVMTWQNGTSYKGGWEHGIMEGKGVSKMGTRTVHRGGYLNGKRHGAGRVLERDGAVYIGRWHKNKKHGKGREVQADGTVFLGRWKSGLRHGRARTTMPDGTVLASTWVDGEML